MDSSLLAQWIDAWRDDMPLKHVAPDTMAARLQRFHTGWHGGLATGMQPPEGTYGWVHLATDPKLRSALEDPWRPQLTEKLCQKTRARGHSPVVLGGRLSWHQPAIFWVWYRFEAGQLVEDIGGEARDAKEHALWRDALSRCGDLHVLTRPQLCHTVHPAKDGTEPERVIDILFPFSFMRWVVDVA